MYKEGDDLLLQEFEKLELDDREIGFMKKFIRNDSAGHQSESLKKHHLYPDTGKPKPLPSFDILRDGPSEKFKDKKTGVLKTNGPYRAGSEWMGWLKLKDVEKQELFEAIKLISVTSAPFRDMGKRLKEIRVDEAKMKQKEFAERLSDGRDKKGKISWTTIRDLEFGIRQIPDKVLHQVHLKFQISREWLISGRGTKHTETGTIDVERITSVEHRMMKLEGIVDINVGVPAMVREGIKDFNIPKASNYELRNELSIAQKELIEQRETTQDLRRLVHSLGDTVELLRGNLEEAKTELEEATKKMASTMDQLQEYQTKSEEQIYQEMRDAEAEAMMADQREEDDYYADQ